MCGLAGVIFGKKRRCAEEREHLAWLFIRLLILSEERGPHATDAAWLDIDRCHRLFKRPVTAERFVKERLRRCRGQITAIIACQTDPETVIVLKGNRPLEMRWHPRRKAVLYASDPAYLDAVLAEEQGWRELPVPPMSLVVFRREDLAAYSVEPFEFVAQERKGAEQ